MDFAEYKDVLVVLELDEGKPINVSLENIAACLLYTSDAADE